MKDVRVDFRFRNALLYNALHDRFQSAANVINRKSLGCLSLAAKLLGLPYGQLLDLVNLRSSPKRKRGTWRPIALTLAAALDSTPELLFPDTLYAEAIPSKCFIEIDSSEVMSLTSRVVKQLSDGSDVEVAIDTGRRDLALRSVLQTLDSREETVLKMRYGLQEDGREYTLDEIGQLLSVSPERVRQIEAKALRQMRHPERTRPLFRFAHIPA